MDKNINEMKILNCPLCKSEEYTSIKDIKIDYIVEM